MLIPMHKVEDSPDWHIPSYGDFLMNPKTNMKTNTVINSRGIKGGIFLDYLKYFSRRVPYKNGIMREPSQSGICYSVQLTNFKELARLTSPHS
jgi:hypothetical protein